LQLPKECKKGEIPVGTFHTHGHGRASPSIHDLWTAYQSNTYCIGGLYHGKKEIKCYDRKKEFNSDIYKRITNDVIIENDFLQKIKDWQNNSKKITEQLFNTTILK
jgi:hypothetical protein